MGIEKFRRKVVVPALDGKSGMQGISTVASGDSFVVITATQVVSGVAIPQINLAQTTVASHRPRVFSVNSVVDNTSFIAVSDAALVAGQQISWVIIG